MRQTSAPPDEADIVVVGAGSAGSVVAAGLSEDPRLRVCLVEAGPADGGIWTRIPIGFSRTFRDPRVNWLYSTVPQAELGGRQIFWPRGRVVGGSSSINGMIHIRGYPQDYDEWAVPGWRWTDVEPVFRSIEGQDCELPDVYGSGGPYAVSSMPVRNKATETFVRAAEAAGIPRVRSFNAGASDGVGYYEINTRNGLRCDAASAYIDPAAVRPNFTLVADAVVETVGFDGLRARSIAIRWKGQRRTIMARAGVVVAAGAVGTPALLQRSGVGPPDAIRRAGIAVRLDQPGIGRNLQDHYGVRYIARLRRPISINDDFRRPWRLIRHAVAYAFSRSGQLAIGGAEAGMFWRSLPEIDRPDVQFHVLPLSNERAGWSFHPFSGMTANVCALRPESRGHVMIASADPDTPPDINPHYLSAASDIATIVRGLRLSRKIFSTSPLKELVEAEHWPGSDAATDKALADHAIRNGSTLFHPVGTCAIGIARDDPLTPELALRGAQALWVVDASVMPRLISGNTNAATLMIAERAVHFLRAQILGKKS